MSRKFKVGITIGDINGVGPETIIKSLTDERIFHHMTVIIYGASKALTFYKQHLKIEGFKFNIVKDSSKLNPKIANVVNIWDKAPQVEMGKETRTAGELALRALDAALKDLAEKKIDFLVTAPLSKNTIEIRDYEFKGHTEYITEFMGKEDSLMMLVTDSLRVGLVTGHVSLSDVSDKFSAELLERKARLMYKSLVKDFMLVKPKIAVLGMNPHAGENGLLGTEEKEVIVPVIKKLRDEGMMFMGPFPSDGFFGNSSFTKFDGVLAMYHDQGLIPFKSLAFHSGVNFTAGLPIVRTSPDHGTGYDIAGKNVASPQSITHALFTGYDIIRNRGNYAEMTSNPLTKTELDADADQ